jgi:hypothetical protein
MNYHGRENAKSRRLQHKEVNEELKAVARKAHWRSGTSVVVFRCARGFTHARPRH